MKSVVLVVPCHNEAQRLDIPAFEAATDRFRQLSFLFVDDGSTDNTAKILSDLVASLPIGRGRLLTISTNVGKAAAVHRGVADVLAGDSTEIEPFAVGYWDADLSTPLSEFEALIDTLDASPETLVVLGSRVKLMGWNIRRHATRHYTGRVFATLASLALGFPVYDTQCGAKVFRVCDDVREVFLHPFRSRWAFDVELLARLAKLQGRDMGKRRVVVEHPLQRWADIPGSKVKLRHLPRMVRDVLLIRLRY